MNHNNLPPSPFTAGMQYGAENYPVPPQQEMHDKQLPPPRISRDLGAKAAEAAVQVPPRIWRGDAETSTSPDIQPANVSIADLQPPQGNAYAGKVSRQMALDVAESANILRAAADAGMSVDQWKATRSQRR